MMSISLIELEIKCIKRFPPYNKVFNQISQLATIIQLIEQSGLFVNSALANLIKAKNGA